MLAFCRVIASLMSGRSSSPPEKSNEQTAWSGDELIEQLWLLTTGDPIPGGTCVTVGLDHETEVVVTGSRPVNVFEMPW